MSSRNREFTDSSDDELEDIIHKCRLKEIELLDKETRFYRERELRNYQQDLQNIVQAKLVSEVKKAQTAAETVRKTAEEMSTTQSNLQERLTRLETENSTRRSVPQPQPQPDNRSWCLTQ